MTAWETSTAPKKVDAAVSPAAVFRQCLHLLVRNATFLEFWRPRKSRLATGEVTVVSKTKRG